MTRRSDTACGWLLALGLGLGLAGLAAAPRAAPAEAASPAASAETRLRLQVGPGRAYTTLGAAARAAPDHAIIEVDPGDYRGDVAVWNRQDVIVRATGPGVRLIADGAHAQGKGIWVLERGSLTVEGITFMGARVPDHNGAGIRLQQGQLTVRRCVFRDNENGILTSNDPGSSLEVENAEFDRNGHGDGLSHNLYVGRIASLAVTGSWFHQARVGHLLKSRARRSRILYNRLTDEAGGRASYELEFPNGGDVLVVGNLIQQAETTENPVMVSYGAEGYEGEASQLRLLHNTLVNALGERGTLLRVYPGPRQVALFNNLWVGGGAIQVGGPIAEGGNLRADPAALARPAAQDFRLRQAAGFEAPPLPEGLAALGPRAEYVHPVAVRRWVGPSTSVGAVQSLAP